MTEQELQEIEEQGICLLDDGWQGKAGSDLIALVAEVRRLREELAAARSKDTDPHFPC